MQGRRGGDSASHGVGFAPGAAATRASRTKSRTSTPAPTLDSDTNAGAIRLNATFAGALVAFGAVRRV